MIWEINLDLISVWYWLYIAVIGFVGAYGSWKHGKAVPIMWAGIMAFIMYCYANVLEPLIFGYQYYDIYSFEWILTSVFGILFVVLTSTFMWNIWNYGSVIE